MRTHLIKRKHYIKNLMAELVLLVILLTGCVGASLPGDNPEGTPKSAGPTNNPISLPENNPSYPLPLFAFIDGIRGDGSTPCADFEESFESNFPVSVSVLYQSIGGGEPYTVTDEATIRAVFYALPNMEVSGENGWARTDDYLTYYFTMKDDRSMRFLFQGNSYNSKGGFGELFSLNGFDALVAALAYPEPPEEICPLYTNERLGFEIELYEGWKARETQTGTVEILPPEGEAEETTTNLVIEFIAGRTAEQAAAEAKDQSRFGTVMKTKDGVRSGQIGGNGVTLEFEKHGADNATVLWTNAQFANDGAGNCYLMYYTTIHKAGITGRITWFDTFASNILHSFRPLEEGH